MRFTRDAFPFIYDENVELEIGKANQLKSGNDIAIIASGEIMDLAIQACNELEELGIEARLLDMHTIKPLDKEAVLKAIRECGPIITIEDHNILNGLGSAVAEVIAEYGKGKLKRIGVRDVFGESGPYEVLLEANGISVKEIVKASKLLLNKC